MVWAAQDEKVPKVIQCFAKMIKEDEEECWRMLVFCPRLSTSPKILICFALRVCAVAWWKAVRSAESAGNSLARIESSSMNRAPHPTLCAHPNVKEWVSDYGVENY